MGWLCGEGNRKNAGPPPPTLADSPREPHPQNALVNHDESLTTLTPRRQVFSKESGVWENTVQAKPTFSGDVRPNLARKPLDIDQARLAAPVCQTSASRTGSEAISWLRRFWALPAQTADALLQTAKLQSSVGKQIVMVAFAGRIGNRSFRGCGWLAAVHECGRNPTWIGRGPANFLHLSHT